VDDLVATPGFGIRLESPVGPIRLDLAYNTQGPESVPVLTSGVEPCGGLSELNCAAVPGLTGVYYRATDQLIALDREVGWSRLDRFWDRLRLQFSIGQAF
jgi:outer membrane protein assembly factor BamA